MKKVISVLMVLVTVVCFAGVVYGGYDVPINQPTIDEGITTAVGNVLGMIQWAGYAIAVGMLIYIGIKYIMASADDKASIKNAAFKYVLGAFLIAGAATIASWVFNTVS